VGNAARVPLPEVTLDQRVLAIARGVPRRRLPGLAAALSAGGIHSLEVTLDSDDALSCVEDLAAAGSDLVIGAGTVLDVASARAAVAAGARFLVMPVLDEAVLRWAVDRGVPALPGAQSPSEIWAAWRAGASAVKLFPAGALGPRYLRELRGPFRDIPIVPTGGVDDGNAAAFLAAGAAALAVGGHLVGDADPSGVTRRAAALRAAMQEPA